MADDSAEIGPGLLENVQLAIRNNIELSFVKKVKIEFKGDRSEVRILALSSHRLYVLTNSRNGCKVDSSMHILEIQKIESSKPLLVTITYGDKPLYLRVAQSSDSSEIIAHIVASLKSNFPSGNPDRLLRLVFGPPEESDARQAHVTTLVNNLKNAEGDTEIGPCGGFSKVYVSMCDLYGCPHLEEVVWDIDTIYLSLNTKELNIQDFDHLDNKDLVPLIAALEFNDWFTKVSCSSFKLGSEVCDAVIRVIKKSSTMEELVLDGVSLGRDHCQKLAMSLTSNPRTSLHSLSLTGNSVEDRGVIHLSGALGKLPHGLVSLCLSDNSITSKGASSLGQALRNNKYNESSLKKLDLCKNSLKGEGVHSLCDFLSKPNMLVHLDLSSTECPLDLLFGALIRGCVQHLSSVHLAGNSFTSKKTKDYVVPPSFKQFFSTSQALKFLDVSDCKLHADAVRAILEGLQENSVVTGVELNLSKNDLRGPGARAIADNMGNLKSITRLDISDNGFEMDLIIILNKLSSNKYLKHLNLGQNSRQRSSAAVMESLVQLISFENSQLESISLADSRLKQDIVPILDALGTNETLKELDISGNHMGDEGARILAKALQINTKLRTLHWDRNSTTFRGFADIAAALECNHILLSMPVPLHDAAQSLKPQTEQSIRKIEKLLLRNQSPHKVVTEQAYRLQQGLLLTSTQQQMADRLVVQLQDLMSGLRHSKDPNVQNELKAAKHYVQDADKLKQLLLKFHLCTNDSDIEARFSALAADFYQAAQDKMKGNMDKMMECAKEVCPHITSSEDVQCRLQSVVEGKSRLSQTFVDEIILTQAAASIANRLSEDKLTVAAVMADAIMEMVIRQLENSVTKLEQLHKGHLNKMDRNEKDNAKSVEEDDVAAVARKARNRLSSVQLMVPAVDGTDEKSVGGRSHKRRPTVNRRPSPGVTIPEEQDITVREAVATVQAVANKTTPKPATQIDFVDMEPKASELRHLVKDRARPPAKRRLPTRPSNRPAVTNGSVDDEETKEENIEVFWSRPATEPEEATSTKTPSKKPKSKSPAPTTTPPVKTAPPKPAPKPKTTPKPRDEESKKSWIPKGGINFNVPGFLKKKGHRDRSHTGNEQTAERTPSRKLSGPSWYNSDDKDVEKTPEKREPARTEIAPTVVGGPSEEKPVVLEESASSTQKPVVSKENDAPQENAPSEIKERSPLEVKPERSPPGGTKPAPFGLKPFVLPRERATTSTALKAPSSQSRERAATADAPLSNPASKEPVRPHGPPKFGVGIGGAEGGGLLAEMKMRQERTASLGRERTAEKPAEAKTDEVDVGKTRRLVPGGKETEPEVTKEGLVKPSSFKRPRLPSGPPPKPAPRPDRKVEKKAAYAAEKGVKDGEKREEKADKRKDRVQQIAGGKDGETEENVQETKEEIQDKIGDKQTEKVQVTNQEEQKENMKQVEKEEASAIDQEEGKENLKEEQKVENPAKERKQLKEKEDGCEEETKEAKDELEGKEHKNDQKLETEDISEAKPAESKQRTLNESAVSAEKASVDDLWIKQPSWEEGLRPGGRSQSVKLQRSTSGSEKIPVIRSATLPKPWSPGEAPSSTLARKLSWEMPKDGVRGGRKERHESKGEAPIQEDPEDQKSITSDATTKQKEISEGRQTKQDSNAEADIGKVQAELHEHGTSSDMSTASSLLNETQL